MATSQHMAIPGGDAPASFWEFLTVAYPPDRWLYNWQYYFVNFLLPGLPVRTPQAANINITVPLFVFAFRSRAERTPTGLAVGESYEIGIAHSSSNDWNQGQWASEIITGDFRGQGQTEYRFAWPREVEESTLLTVTANSLNTIVLDAQDLRIHAGVVALECRRRQAPPISPVRGV